MENRSNHISGLIACRPPSSDVIVVGKMFLEKGI